MAAETTVTADAVLTGGPERVVTGGRAARVVRLTIRYLVLTLLAAIVLFPVYMTVVNSLLQPDLIVRRPPTLFPTDPQWDTYSTAFDAGHLGLYLRNSFVQAGLITILQVGTSILAAYAFTFLVFPLRNLLFVLFLATLMVPFEVTIVTNYDTVVNVLGWQDSFQGLVIPFAATGFGAFLLRQAFLQVPRDLEDAAKLDGYGHWRFMARVVVPLSRPAIAALTVFAFLLAWNQYLWPLLITDDEQYRTVQIGLKRLVATQIDQVNVTFAGTVIAALPLFILLLVFQKQLIRGLTAGAVKG